MNLILKILDRDLENIQNILHQVEIMRESPIEDKVGNLEIFHVVERFFFMIKKPHMRVPERLNSYINTKIHALFSH